MDRTQHLALPYLAAAQAQKHVTHNEALERLDALVHLAVLDRDLAAPPASPVAGSRYLVATGAIGLWLGKSGQIAHWTDGYWDFLVPQAGWICWVADEQALIFFDGTTWQAAANNVLTTATAKLGINATADTTNRLSVAAAATLLSHEGAGHQVKVNKNAAANTASLLFQSGFSGRAEMGLTGDDDFHLKVSANGTAWTEAMVVNRTSGAVSFPNTVIGAVTSVAGRTGAVVLASGDVSGLGTAAVKNVGVANGNVPVMDATGYPAADGSRITGLVATQTGHAGKVLTTNGTATAFTDQPKTLTTAKAWVVFNGTSGASPVIKDAFNVASVTRVAAGEYTITFTSALASANVAVVGSTVGATDANWGNIICGAVMANSTGSVRIRVYNPGAGGAVDINNVSVIVFGT